MESDEEAVEIESSKEDIAAENDNDLKEYSNSPFRKTSSYGVVVNEPNEIFYLNELNLVDCYVSPYVALGSMARDIHCKDTPSTPFGTAKIGIKSSNEAKEKERIVIKSL